MRQFSLSFLTCCGAPPEDAAVAAVQAGYEFLGLRLLPAAPGGIAFPLMEQPSRVRNLKAMLRNIGVSIFDIEIIRISEDFSATDYEAFFACAAELGARAILVAGDDGDYGRMTDNFARLCEAAAPYGLSMDLEFMPQSAVRCVGDAVRILHDAAQPNQGIIVDALHVSRCGATAKEISAIPQEWLHYAQMCDGPAEIPVSLDELNYAARHARLMPGDGAIDLPALFAALPKDIPVAVEVPNDQQSRGLALSDWAALGRNKSLAVLAQAQHDGATQAKMLARTSAKQSAKI